MSQHVLRVADQLLLIERELRLQGFWQELPPSEQALASQSPFCVDTMDFDQWLQWVMLPRMKVLLEGGHPLPRTSGIKEMAEWVYRDRLNSVQALIMLLGEFDQLLMTAE